MWELIRANQRRSIVLFVLMGIGLALLGAAIGYFLNPAGMGIDGVVIALLLWIVMALVSYYRGAKILLSASKAKKVTSDVHPQLFNIVEEMKIASGMEYMPEIYIINEEAPNAFAAGRSPKHAVVAVTAGLLARLNRDELQGVIAHEMGHIHNRDIRFMTLAGVMLGSIVLISQIFLRGMLFTGGGARYRSSNSNSGQGQAIMMIVALVLAILVPIFAGLLYYSISRKREYLADATGVRFSRYPEGLASALEKISGTKIEMKTSNDVTAPMYISLPFSKKKKAAGLYSTHPPIEERIKILRAMQGVGFQSYDKAYAAVSGKKSHIIPGSGLAEADDTGVRKAFDDRSEKRSVKRESGDIMMAVNQYQFINCECGLRIKVPPEYSKKNISCPRCGRGHTV
ncbi:MAG: M48 family metallopeptidase [Bacteroidales bacterium]|jgi:heat shock protein HtpX|nr:M48 family metallopeptidase [Bacteroidales bacterium]